MTLPHHSTINEWLKLKHDFTDSDTSSKDVPDVVGSKYEWDLTVDTVTICIIMINPLSLNANAGTTNKKYFMLTDLVNPITLHNC